jgi:CDP-glucose 4,6-dehydratase
VRDYFYIEDGAAAYILLAEELTKSPGLRGAGFNFSNETPVSVEEIVDRIIKLMDSSLEAVILNEASNEIKEQYLNSAKARKMLNWKPIVSLEEGLSLTIAWYKDYFREVH